MRLPSLLLFVSLVSACADLDPTGSTASNPCNADEISAGGDCWGRCRGDERWAGDHCTSGLSYMSFMYAEGDCTGAVRLPTVDEVTALLDHCTTDENGNQHCYDCASSPACAAAFGNTPDVSMRTIWTSTPCTFLGNAGYFVGVMDTGDVLCWFADQPGGSPECVRTP